MVLALLLSDPNTPVRYSELGRVVLQCLHVIHSMEQALTIFDSALKYSDLEGSSDSPKEPPSQLLAAFDAHVGDCACQTRVQMLWELVKLYSLQDNADIFTSATTLLKELKVNAVVLLEEIKISHGKPRNPKLSGLSNHLAIWDRIRFTSFLELVNDSSCKNAPGIHHGSFITWSDNLLQWPNLNSFPGPPTNAETSISTHIGIPKTSWS